MRIHDEYCEMAADHCISDLGRIISASYKRRQLLSREEGPSPVIAAANIGNVTMLLNRGRGDDKIKGKGEGDKNGHGKSKVSILWE